MYEQSNKNIKLITMKNKIKNLRLRIKLFYVFLQSCCLFPNEIKVNWDDMNRRYYNETDPEMLKIFKELEDEGNFPR
jgi:hypothetical protein